MDSAGELRDIVDEDGGDGHDKDKDVAEDDGGVCEDYVADDEDLVSHVVGGQHGQQLTEKDGPKEQSEDPL